MKQPLPTQLADYEASLIADLQKATRSLLSITRLLETPQRNRVGQMADECAKNQHENCEDNNCDCQCHSTHTSRPLPNNYQGIRNHAGGKKYEHGDQTADKALDDGGRPKQWLERFYLTQSDLSWLARNAVHLVGEPSLCIKCDKPIKDNDRTRLRGTWHQGCYLRHVREIS